jgi:hypothetical protein
MLLRARSHVRRGWTGDAVISADHPVAAHGTPVLLIDGKPVDPATALLADYEILEATAAELELLHRGGYRFDLEVA